MGQVLCDRHRGGRTSRARIDHGSSRSKEHNTVVLIKTVNIHVEWAATKVVDQLDCHGWGGTALSNLRDKGLIIVIGAIQGVISGDDDVLDTARLHDSEVML